MKYEVDQSGKIEQTNLDTIISLTNGETFSIVLRKNDKRILEKLFKKLGKRKSYPLLVFASLVAIIIQMSSIKQKITIDREYAGHENTIRERALHYLQYLKVQNNIQLEFGHVGKSSKAHDIASKVASKRMNPTRIVHLEEILDLFFESKKKDRGRNRLKKA